MEAQSTKKPAIFIHAPWRSGSTFLFELFRRHEDRYFAFQEPLNDLTVVLRDNPEELLATDNRIAASLRHPVLDKPYFFELCEVGPAWRGRIDKAMLYDDYFGTAQGVDSSAFFAALIDAAPRTPVIQECRTLQRIGKLKERLGGFHIAAFRNPVDLWWSQKINDFFDAGRSLCINAENPPSAILRFREKTGFREFRHSDLVTEQSFYRNVQLSAADSYLGLHILWSLAVVEAHSHADMILNMDALSIDKSVQQHAIATLGQNGIPGIALDECHLPMRRLSAKERARFAGIEEESFTILAEAGVPIDIVRHFAETFPTRPEQPEADDQQVAEQYRDIVWRLEDRQAGYAGAFAELEKASPDSADPDAAATALVADRTRLAGGFREASEHYASMENAYRALSAGNEHLAGENVDLQARLGVLETENAALKTRLMEAEATLTQGQRMEHDE